MSADRYRVVINPEYASSDALRSFVETLPQRFEEVGQQVFKKRNTVRVADDDFGFKSLHGVAVKQFKDPGFLRGLYYTFIGTTKAYRGYTNALELQKRGVDTPTPLAYIEGCKGGLKRVGYLITDKTNLPSIQEDLYYEDRFDTEVADRFGAFVAGLHAKGVLHGDLNCDNVLIDKQNSPFSFYLIDVNRMQFTSDGEALRMDSRLKNLCQFTRSVENVRHVATAYARNAGLPAGFAETAARFKQRFNRRRARKKRFTRLFKPSTP